MKNGMLSRRGLDFCLNMVDQEGLVKSQYINGKISQDYFEGTSCTLHLFASSTKILY